MHVWLIVYCAVCSRLTMYCACVYCGSLCIVLYACGSQCIVLYACGSPCIMQGSIPSEMPSWMSCMQKKMLDTRTEYNVKLFLTRLITHRPKVLYTITMWARIPPETAHFSFGKVTDLGVLCCFALLFV